MADDERKESKNPAEEDLELTEDAQQDVKGGMIIHGGADKGGKGDIIINFGPNKAPK